MRPAGGADGLCGNLPGTPASAQAWLSVVRVLLSVLVCGLLTQAATVRGCAGDQWIADTPSAAATWWHVEDYSDFRTDTQHCAHGLSGDSGCAVSRLGAFAKPSSLPIFGTLRSVAWVTATGGSVMAETGGNANREPAPPPFLPLRR